MDSSCPRKQNDTGRCTKTKAVLMVERPRVQCDYPAGHSGKHKAVVIDKKQEKMVEWS